MQMHCRGIIPAFSYRQHQEQTRSQQLFLSSYYNSAGGQAARLDVIRLDQVVHSLYQAGLAQSTQKAYATGKRRYMEFCRKIVVVPLPTTEKQLCCFVAYLREEGLRYQMVKSYLSAVRYMQISNDMGDPKIGSMSQLELVVRGMKRDRQASLQGQSCLLHQKY